MPLPLPAISKTILVVEDNAPLLDLVQTILKEAGFTVLTAATAGDDRACRACEDDRSAAFRRNDA
jgi:DNA-binding response OmpR family regulator